MRSNPKYDSTCWIRFGRYQYRKCDACKRKEECDDTIGAQIEYNGLSEPTKTRIIAPICEKCGAKMNKKSEKTRKRIGQITPIYAYFYCNACDFKKGYVYETIRN